MIQELNLDGQVPANALLGRSKRLLGRVKRLLKTEERHAPVFRMAVIFLLLVTLGIAAITIASAGNQGVKKSLEKFLMVKPEKLQIVADTTKTKKHEKTAIKTESGNAEDSKKQKEMAEAARKLEKAQFEMQKAQLELEKAREEFVRAGGQMRSLHMADLSEDQAKHFMMNEQMREFKLQHEKEFDEQRRNMEMQRRAMEDHLRRSQEEMREKMMGYRNQDWQINMKEWEESSKEMQEAMKDFYKTWKDSDLFMKHRNPHMNAFPEAPVPPPVPHDDIEAPAPPDVQDLVQPEPVESIEMLNDNQGTGKKENAEQLDFKLKEVETE